MSIIEKLGITQGRFIINKKTDSSGDRDRITYDILASHPWGCNGLVSEMDNPNDVLLFCASKDMFKSLINLIEMTNPITKDNDGILYWQMAISAVEEATGKTWEQIKELL